MSILGTVSFYDPETRQGIEAAFTKFKDGKFYCSAFAKSRALETVGSFYKYGWYGSKGWEHEEKSVKNIDYIKNTYSTIEVEDGLYFERDVMLSDSSWNAEVQASKRCLWKNYSLWYCSCKDNEFSETTRLKQPCKHCKKYCSFAEAKIRPWRYRLEENEQKLLDEQDKICGAMGVPQGVPVPTKTGCGLNEYRRKKCRNRYRGTKSDKQKKEFRDKKDENEMTMARGNGKNKHLSHFLKKKKRHFGYYNHNYHNNLRSKYRRRLKQTLILGDACDNVLGEKIPRKLTAKPWENY